jgi:hypothetical protein
MAPFTKLKFPWSFSPYRYIWILLLLMTVVTVFCFFRPLVLSVDSTYGFLAYKGTLFFRQFNVIQQIPVNDMGRVNPVFMSWWSPGQWLFPGALNAVLGIRLGVGAILVSVIALVTGFIGYYRLFLFFNFSFAISLLSILIIFSSSTLYYSLIVYQGGEVLEFAFFPWYLLYVMRIHKISIWNILVTAALFLFCFIAKTTLLIYGPLVVAARIIHIYKAQGRIRLHLFYDKLLLMLPILVLVILIYVNYLSRGPRPVLMNHFNISAEGILVPLTAPLCSILSIQEWIGRVVKLLSGILHLREPSIFLLMILYIFILCILVWAIRCLIMDQEIDKYYKNLFFILFSGLIAFFLFAYSLNANIDFSSRHFKLLGYLFVPALMTILFKRVSRSLLQLILGACCLISLADIIYLKEKWVKDHDISVNYFYRNCEPPPAHDPLDRDSYKELLRLDDMYERGKKPFIFFVESSADIAIDLHHPFILQRPEEDIREKIYHKRGLNLLVCISKNTLKNNKGIVQSKFPDYTDFKIVAETYTYLFLLSGTGQKDD